MYKIKDKCSVTSTEFYIPTNKILHRKQKSQMDIQIKTRNLIINGLNNHKFQSPKVSVGISREKVWSYLDVNLNKVSRGLNIPIQYRKNNEFRETFYILNYKDKFSFQNNELNENHHTKIYIDGSSNFNEFNNKTFIRDNSKINEQEKFKEEIDGNFQITERSKILRDEEKLKVDGKTTEKIESKEEYKEPIIYEYNQIENKQNLSAKREINFRKVDNFGLEYFKVNSKNKNNEEGVTNHHNLKKIMNYNNRNTEKNNKNFDGQKEIENSNNYLKNNNQEITAKSEISSLEIHGLEYKKMLNKLYENRQNHPEQKIYNKQINQKMLKSDIFFLKDSKNLSIHHNDNNSNHSNIYENYSKNATDENIRKNPSYKFNDSDIFNVKNNQISLNKIGEKYLTKEKFFDKKFNSSSRSNSEWCPKTNLTSLINYESTNYDLFNARLKKNNLTKNDIIQMAHGGNPNHYQKSISEILDLTRVGVPNFNKEYSNAFNGNGRVFMKKVNLCDSFNNLFGEYKGLCDKPFVKKII